jgi:hypothetical protein
LLTVARRAPFLAIRSHKPSGDAWLAASQASHSAPLRKVTTSASPSPRGIVPPLRGWPAPPAGRGAGRWLPAQSVKRQRVAPWGSALATEKAVTGVRA